MGRLRAECDIAISKGEEKGDIWVTALGLAHVSCFFFAFCNYFSAFVSPEVAHFFFF